MGKWIIEARKLTKTFVHKKTFSTGHAPVVRAVDDVSLAIETGTVMGLVGESGCGKSTLGRVIVRLYEPDTGEVFFHDKNVTGLSNKELCLLRRKIQIIFQDPADSFDPRFRIKSIICEGLNRFYKEKTSAWKNEKILDVLDVLRLRLDMLNRYPHELSGGERQRIGIARSLVLEPEFIVCDEPVSSLDVSVQAEILNLLMEIREKRNLTYLFISHDLRVVEYLCTDVAVMYLGRIVEQAKKEELFSRPKHPYTQALLNAQPLMLGSSEKKNWKSASGDVPDPLHVPPGCSFHPRCPYKMDVCAVERPVLREISSGHYVACHLD